MRIYHYTNIETLALILKNKTIRFNRLDRVDDLEEGQTESSGIKTGLYTFVSCWTEDPEESIPLWKMYTNNGVGVRIGLDKEMFKKYEFHNGDIINGDVIHADGIVKKPVSPTSIISSDYWVFPNFNDGVFYKKIEYVPDVSVAIKNAVKKDANGVNQMQTSQWGIFKNKRWAFQDERRFTLIIFPKPNDISISNPAYGDWLKIAFEKGIYLPFHYFDLELSDNVLNDIEITLCPNMSEGHKTLVECLCKTYLDNIMPKESSLSGVVYLK